MEDMGMVFILFSFYLMFSKLCYTARRLKIEAETDPLTELFNRRSFFRELEKRIKSGERFSVAILDLDNMKRINDTLGHQEGDRVLEAVSKALKKSIREDDLAARYGGDEFAVLFTRQGPPPEKFRGRFKANLDAELAKLKNENLKELSFSLGLAYYPQDGQDISSLLRIADTKMYAEKEAKKKSCRDSRIT